MSTERILHIEQMLSSFAQELWDVDGPDDLLDALLYKVSLLRAQLEVQRCLQHTANLLRQQPLNKALPNQRATKVKHLICLVYRRNDRGNDRSKQLRAADCDTLKLVGLACSTEEWLKLRDDEFDTLASRATDFLNRRNLSMLLYRRDIDKAFEATLEDPEDEEQYHRLLQVRSTRRLHSLKHRKDERRLSDSENTTPTLEIPEPDFNGLFAAASKPSIDPTIHGEVYALSIEDFRSVLASTSHVGSIYLTIPKTGHNSRASVALLSAWISNELSCRLGVKGKPLPLTPEEDDVWAGLA
ncbi:hypothetical protein BAUCODRAFT_436465 [Baudoinia panamericana UAMH 10762]|uniref:Uncharacterized protein n=1 Tax=Baudoinia panamericana (strain UAMH 10762) TaxID=717646 RepID=M2NDS0_BAUPA|nr:uncharacterized protein BAUCODRAFT_436465 [Baudoinia panamericana UAMH 10762]EMC97045.1 hypothetical protein BAUCODRAFT_436465 [Baudoinia panamericana UAMH 10762]